MKTFEERKSEIFRRSEIRIKKRKILTLSSVLILVFICTAILAAVFITHNNSINSNNKDIPTQGIETFTFDQGGYATKTVTINSPNLGVNTITYKSDEISSTQGSITGYAGSHYVLINDSNGEPYSKSLLEKPLDLSEGISLTVDSTFDFKTTSKLSNVDIDIYVFCDGQIIKHAESVDGEAVEVTRHSVGNGEKAVIPLYIPPTSIGDVDETLLWVCINYMPEYVPVDWYEVDNIFMEYIPVCSKGEGSNSPVYEAKENYYIYDKRPLTVNVVSESMKIHDVDIGEYHEDTFSAWKSDIYELPEIKDDTDFSVVAYFEDDADYYLAVLCNGELIDLFDGNTFMKINCAGGKRMVKYSIDKSDLPENGVYAYQVIALTSQDNSAGLEWFLHSNRRRMDISLEN